MVSRAGTLLTVVLLVLLVIGSGPAVAYQSSQHVTPPTTADIGPDDQTISTNDISKVIQLTNDRHSLSVFPGNKSNGNNGEGNKNGNNGQNQSGDETTGQQNNGENSSNPNGNGDKDNTGQGNEGNGNNGNSNDGDKNTNSGPDGNNGNDNNSNNGNDNNSNNGNDNNSNNGNERDSNEGQQKCGQGQGTKNKTSRDTARGNETRTTDNTDDCKQGRSLTVEDGDIELGPNASALAHRRAARKLLRTLNISGPGNSGQAFERKRQRLLASLNDTFKHHLDTDRALSAAVFKTDHRIGAQLNSKAPNVTRHLVASDRLLADQAITDAETVQSDLDARNTSYNDSAVTYHITEAQRAYQQGLAQPDQASHAASEHYRRAWTHAQRALDIMDEAVTPNVTINRNKNVSRPFDEQDRLALDYPRNGSSTLWINGTVSDIRGYELTARLSVNNTTREITLAADTKPLSEVTFNRSVELNRQWPAFENGTLTENGTLRTYTVAVTVKDPGVDLADQGYDQKQDLHGPQAGEDARFFDGDGLPGWYERQVTGTDPLNPDSSSDFTNISEADDGVIDGVEDFDGDGLLSAREIIIGTAPLNSDTDGDNLTDSWELSWGYDPTAPDSNQDGISDSQEDPDNDSVTNAVEQRYGTSPISNDTDDDGLSDDREIFDVNTNATQADSDNDNLKDGDELIVGTDPQNPDTDDDGTLDGNETFETETSDAETGVNVTVRGKGNVARGISIQNVSGGNISEVKAGPAAYITNNTSFSNATVRVPLNDTVDKSNASNLTLVKLEPGSGEGWTYLNTTVDTANQTLEATVTSFSVVMPVNGEKFRDMTRARFEPGWPNLETFEDGTGWDGNGTVENDVLIVSNQTSTEEDDNGNGDGDNDGDDDSNTGSDCNTKDNTVDCDEDGLSNGEEKEIGTKILNNDTDSDGLEDGLEASVNGLDPLDEDSDGDGIIDGEDNCPTYPGDCPIGASSLQSDELDSGTGSDSVSTDENAARAYRTLTVQEQGTAEIMVSLKRADRQEGRITVLARDETGVKTVVYSTTSSTGGFVTRSADISELSGTVTIEIIAEGNATAAIDRIAVARDADNDGLRDSYEKLADDLKQPYVIIQNNKRTLVTKSIDPVAGDDDTDGDGLLDGEEIGLELEKRKVGGKVVARYISVDTTEFYSHPNDVNSDNTGLPDKREGELGSNAKQPESLSVNVNLPTNYVSTKNGISPMKKPGELGVSPQDGKHWTVPQVSTDNQYRPGDGICIINCEPDWVKEEYDLKSGRTYHRINASLVITVSEYMQQNIGKYKGDLPTDIDISFPNAADNLRIVDIDIKNDDRTFEPGVYQVNIIIEEPKTDESATSSPRDILDSLGEMEVDTYMREDKSIFYHNNDSYKGMSWNDGVAEFTTENVYGYQFDAWGTYKKSGAVGTESLRKLAEGALILLTAGTASTWYLTSQKVSITVIAVLLELGPQAEGVPSTPNGPGLITRTYIGSTTAFTRLGESELSELEEGTKITTRSGPFIRLQN